jgi:hypothetical protein
MSSSASALPLRRSRTSAAADTAPSSLTRYRRGLQFVLGLIWLVDAGLQYQHYMFTRDFVTQTLEPAAAGTPSWVQRPALWADRFMLPHIAFYNALFATLQLVIALAIFYRPTIRLGLALSAAWALGIWWLGEGIGGITLGVPAVMGAPGAAVVYALISVLVWPRATRARAGRTEPRRLSVADASPLGRWLPKLIWAVVWIGMALLGLESANRAPGALHDAVAGMSDGEPGWIRTLDRGLAAPLAHHGLAWSIGLAVLLAVVALGVFAPAATRPVLALAIVLGVAIWLAEDFGEVFTGSATDVNSGPLLVLLAATFWPLSARAPLTGAAR